MIICFSGTGNSSYVADTLSSCTDERILRFTADQLRDPQHTIIDTRDDDRVIWVMPVHCWGLPKTMEKIIKHSTLRSDRPVTHYLIYTCGDDIGLADLRWKKLMKKRGWTIGAAYSVEMPNTYVFLPGFDVDTPELTRKKLQAMPERVKTIAQHIEARKPQEHGDVTRGSFPWIKTNVIRPLFMRFYTGTALFQVTDACNGCGKCARECPLGIITILNDKPERRGECTMCLRCYHCCRQHAVDYMHTARTKGQYICKEANQGLSSNKNN